MAAGPRRGGIERVGALSTAPTRQRLAVAAVGGARGAEEEAGRAGGLRGEAQAARRGEADLVETPSTSATAPDLRASSMAHNVSAGRAASAMRSAGGIKPQGEEAGAVEAADLAGGTRPTPQQGPRASGRSARTASSRRTARRSEKVMAEAHPAAVE